MAFSRPQGCQQTQILASSPRVDCQHDHGRRSLKAPLRAGHCVLSLRHMSSIPPPAPAGRCVKASAAKHTEEGTAVSSGRGLFHHTEHHLPELIVFDLDNTLWTPELYQLKSPPKAWKNIRLFEGAVAALNELVDAPEWSDVRVAAASRANKIKEAHRLLTEFKLAGGTSLSELFVACEVYPGSKKKHFGQIRKKTGISYDRMIFFDDDIGNCTEVSDLGVTCVKVNSGLSFSTWQKAMQVYADMMANGMHMGRTLTQGDLQNMTGVTRCSASDDYSGSALLDASSTKQSSGGSPEVGTLKWYRQDKGYGFIQPANGSGDVFIGSRSLGEVSPGSMLPGLKVGFRRVQQSNGKDFASALHLVDGEADGGAEPVGGTSYPCFSMSQPFAALLVNGAKTLESRNSPMLSELEGQRVALHVGRRDWQGLDKHVEILRKRGLDDSAIRNLSELPAGGRRGDVVALLTLGKTWAPGAAERRSAALADGVLAPEEGIGKYVTEVTGVQVLSKPFKCSGQPGLWGCTLPDSSIQAP